MFCFLIKNRAGLYHTQASVRQTGRLLPRSCVNCGCSLPVQKVTGTGDSESPLVPGGALASGSVFGR